MWYCAGWHCSGGDTLRENGAAAAAAVERVRWAAHVAWMGDKKCVQQTCTTYCLLAAGTIVRPVTSFGNNIYVVKIVVVRQLKIKCWRRQWIYVHRYADGCSGATTGGTESSKSLPLSGPTGAWLCDRRSGEM